MLLSRWLSAINVHPVFGWCRRCDRESHALLFQGALTPRLCPRCWRTILRGWDIKTGTALWGDIVTSDAAGSGFLCGDLDDAPMLAVPNVRHLMVIDMEGYVWEHLSCLKEIFEEDVEAMLRVLVV